MKEFYVMLGGAQRKLRYTSRDGIEAKKRLGKPLWKAAAEAERGDLEILAVLLELGLRHNDPNISEESLLGSDTEEGLIDKAIQEGGSQVMQLYADCLNAAAYAGLLNLKQTDAGFKIKAEKGKADGDAATPQAVPAAS